MSSKLLSMLKNKEISKSQIKDDVKAGIIVSVIALPLCIALAMSSGVSPEKGLITAVFAGLVISIFGGSKVQIGGPTAAFVVVVYGVIKNHGMDGLIISTIMAGIMLIIMGLLKLGNLIKHVPRSITLGFTSGIAVTLFITQIKDLFGLKIEDVPAKSLPKIDSYFENLDTFHFLTFVVGISCVLTMIYWPKVNKKIPGSIIVLILATVLVNVFNINIDTIGSVSDNIVAKIPTIHIPNINLSKIKVLIQPAFSIAILAGIQALLSCLVTDEMIDDKHNSNTELIAQGIANIVSALFGGIPATGAVARTVSNVKNNGKTPIAGIIHCLILLVVVAVLMPLTKMIPMTVLSSILIVVSFNMGDWAGCINIIKGSKKQAIVLITTFVFTIVFDLVLAIAVGMIMHLLFTSVMRDKGKELILEEVI